MVSVCAYFFHANINTSMFMEKFIDLVYQIMFCSGQAQGKISMFHKSWKNIFSYKIILSVFFFLLLLLLLTWDFLSKRYFSYNAAISPTTNFNRQKTLKWALFLFFLIKSFFGSYVLYGVKDTFQHLKIWAEQASFYLSAFDFVHGFIVRENFFLFWLHSLNWMNVPKSLQRDCIFQGNNIKK